MLLRFLFAIAIFSLPLSVQAVELSFHEDCRPITKASSNVYQYQTDSCPDISYFNSCAYHNGMNFSSFTTDMDMSARVDSILKFYADSVQTCAASCEGEDLGACLILGQAIPPFNSMDGGQQQFVRLGFLQKACIDGGVEACNDAGYETAKIWAASSTARVECPEPKFFSFDHSCDSPDTLLGYVKSNAIEVASPADFYARGCDLQNGTSCRLLMNFYLENPNPSFDPAQIVEEVCEFGNKLDCNGAKSIARKFK